VTAPVFCRVRAVFDATCDEKNEKTKDFYARLLTLFLLYVKIYIEKNIACPYFGKCGNALHNQGQKRDGG
jgi:hypothetical protein